MAIRYKALTELYHETQRSVTAPAQWQAFLASACRNYRLSFDEMRECCQNLTFVFGVGKGGGFVQQDNRGVF